MFPAFDPRNNLLATGTAWVPSPAWSKLSNLTVPGLLICEMCALTELLQGFRQLAP